MKAIVATDKMWGIGKDGKLLFNIKEDMEFFKTITCGKIIVMGRKTYESIGKALPGRINFIVTNNAEYKKLNEHFIEFGTLEEINYAIKQFDTDDVFIIGGESIYKKFLNRCDTVYHTKYDAVIDSDAEMPNLAFNNFEYIKTIRSANYFGIDYTINIWKPCGPKGHKGVINVVQDKNIHYMYTDDFNYYFDVYQGTEITDMKYVQSVAYDLLSWNFIYSTDKISDGLYRTISVPKNAIYGNKRCGGISTECFGAFGGSEDESRLNLIRLIKSIINHE